MNIKIFMEKLKSISPNNPHRIPRTVPLFKQYSHHLAEHLHHSYATPLSYKDQLVTLEQAQTVALIRQIIKNMNLIIRLTDKGNNFYIGLASEFEKKVEKFFSDTNAFVELSYNPFNEALASVIELLDKLQSKKLILQWQHKKWCLVERKLNCHIYILILKHIRYFACILLLLNSFEFLFFVSFRKIYQFDPLKTLCVHRPEIFPSS